MISISMLDVLQDAEIRTTIEQAEGILKQRDADRKAKAIENARATLAAAGLTLKDLGGNSKGRLPGGLSTTAGTPISTRPIKRSYGTGRAKARVARGTGAARREGHRD